MRAGHHCGYDGTRCVLNARRLPEETNRRVLICVQLRACYMQAPHPPRRPAQHMAQRAGARCRDDVPIILTNFEQLVAQKPAPATAASTWPSVQGSFRPLTVCVGLCFFLSHAGGPGPARRADACVGRTPHQGESVSRSRRSSGMAATAVRFSSVFSEQPLTPAVKRLVSAGTSVHVDLPLQEPLCRSKKDGSQEQGFCLGLHCHCARSSSAFSELPTDFRGTPACS